MLEGSKSVGRKKYARSAITNGRRLLTGKLDLRSGLGRRYRDIFGALASDQGGEEYLSEARLQLCRRFSACACIAEAMESELIGGKQIHLNDFALLCSTLVRLAARIGVDRRARSIVPALADYLDVAAQAEAEEAEPAG